MLPEAGPRRLGDAHRYLDTAIQCSVDVCAGKRAVTQPDEGIIRDLCGLCELVPPGLSAAARSSSSAALGKYFWLFIRCALGSSPSLSHRQSVTREIPNSSATRAARTRVGLGEWCSASMESLPPLTAVTCLMPILSQTWSDQSPINVVIECRDSTWLDAATRARTSGLIFDFAVRIPRSWSRAQRHVAPRGAWSMGADAVPWSAKSRTRARAMSTITCRDQRSISRVLWRRYVARL
jgi:hypothetical protein